MTADKILFDCPRLTAIIREAESEKTIQGSPVSAGIVYFIKVFSEGAIYGKETQFYGGH